MKKWLIVQFPKMKVSLEPRRSGYKLSGVLAWRGFKGMEPIDRQSLLRHALQAEFSREDYSRISLLITLTPAEYAVYREPQLA